MSRALPGTGRAGAAHTARRSLSVLHVELQTARGGRQGHFSFRSVMFQGLTSAAGVAWGRSGSAGDLPDLSITQAISS